MKKYKYLIFSILAFLLAFVFNEKVYAADATCIYESNNLTYTFNVNADGNGSVNYELTHTKNNPNDRLTYFISNQEIAANNFIDSKNNKIMCPNDLYYKISGGNSSNTAVTVSFVKFNGAAAEPLYLSDKSTNNDVTLGSKIINSCAYNGKNVVNGNIVSKVYINLTDKGLTFEATNGYEISTVDEENINTTTFTKDTNCSDFTVYVTCGNYQNAKYCTINKDNTIRPGTGTGGVDNPDASVINSGTCCTYKTGNNEYIYFYTLRNVANNKKLPAICYGVNCITNKFDGNNAVLINTQTQTRWNAYLENIVDCRTMPQNIWYDSNKNMFYTSDPGNNVIKATIDTSNTCNSNLTYNASDIQGSIDWGDQAEVNCEGIIGDELLDFINKIFRWIQIAAPIVVIIFGVIEFGGAVLLDDKDALKKASTKFIKRLIIAAILFFIPLIITWLLTIFNEITGAASSTCGIGG